MIFVYTYIEVEKEVFQTGPLRFELPDERKSNTNHLLSSKAALWMPQINQVTSIYCIKC